MEAMTDQEQQAGQDEPPHEGPGADRSAAQDLADGLDLMLRAAKKAMRSVDPQNIESIGRRAFDNLELLNKKRVEELRTKARQKLDPRRIEEIAEEAGKELLKVVERVAERVDSIVTRGGSPPSDRSPHTKPSQGDEESEAAGGNASADETKRVRVADD